MIEYSECSAAFFTKDGVNKHNNYCIGYKPDKQLLYAVIVSVGVGAQDEIQ